MITYTFYHHFPVDNIMNKNYFLSVSKAKLSLNVLKFLYNDNAGAIVTFIGVVKKTNEEKIVNYINYSVFHDLTYALLKKQCLILLKNDLSTRILIQQREGIVKVNEINLIIGVSSTHRFKAFSHTECLIEFIKSQTPVWKKEYYKDDTYSWLNSK